MLVDGVTVYDSEQAFRLRAPAQVRIYNAVVHDVDTAFRIEDGIEGVEILHATLGLNITEAFDEAGGGAGAPAGRGLACRRLLPAASGRADRHAGVLRGGRGWAELHLHLAQVVRVDD